MGLRFFLFLGGKNRVFGLWCCLGFSSWRLPGRKSCIFCWFKGIMGLGTSIKLGFCPFFNPFFNFLCFCVFRVGPIPAALSL